MRSTVTKMDERDKEGRWGDGENGRRGEREVGRTGGGENGRWGERGTGRMGDGENGRRGERETRRYENLLKLTANSLQLIANLDTYDALCYKLYLTGCDA
jgi:hypothetical protein